MKKTNIIYWILTILFSGIMIATAVPDVILQPEAVKFIKMLGYPEYFIVFIGVAKILGGIAILIPGFNRIKEWAYAGLFFDLIAALYSFHCTVGIDAGGLVFILGIASMGIGSYIFHHKKLKEQNLHKSIV